ncbi:putative transcription factor GRAS family [Helianthus annuus]|nr:putative transcription factor GRAS family [Helianthus annuus]KAJ0789058.1 putative transcription factor GRAS family [Helianthus annuus]
MFDLRNNQVLAVNLVFELHQLLARPGAIDEVLSAVKQMSPGILTVVEQEANHNGTSFLERFTESLHYYSTLFDSLKSNGGGGGGVGGGAAVNGEVDIGVNGSGVSPVNGEDRFMSEMYLGK